MISEFVISNFSLFYLQIAFVLICVFIGNNLMIYPFKRQSSNPENLDLIQNLCYSTISGFVLMIVILQILSFIGIFVSIGFYAIILASIAIMMFRIQESLKFNTNIRDYLRIPKLEYILLFIIVLITNYLAFSIPVGLAGSTNADAGYHTFFIRIILDNDLVLAFPYPYFEYLLYQPSGAHLIGALVTGIGLTPIQAAVVSIGTVFPAIIVLGAYSTIRTITSNNYISLLGAILILTSNNLWHPLSFTFTVQMIEFIIIAGSGMIIWAYKSNSGVPFVILSSLVISAAAYIHPIAVLYIVMIGGFSTVFIGFFHNWKDLNIRKFLLRVPKVIIILILAIILWIPAGSVTYIFLTNSTIGLPEDWLIPALRETWNLSNASLYIRGDIFNPINLLKEATKHGALFFLGPLTALMVPIIWFRYPKSEKLVKIRETCLISVAFLVSFLAVVLYLRYFSGYTSNVFVNIFRPPRAWEMMFIPLTVLSSIAILNLYQIVQITVPEISTTTFRNLRLVKAKNIWPCILLFIAGGMVFVGIPYYNQGFAGNVLYHVERANTNIGGFNRLSIDDIRVFDWIISNTSEDEVFLVSQVDGGQYLTSVTQRLGIYPYGPAADSSIYRRLCLGITSDPTNPYLLPLFEYYNISYIFAGSLIAEPSTSTWEKEVAEKGSWTKNTLSKSPFLREVFSSNMSALFEVVYSDFIGLGPSFEIFNNPKEITGCENTSGWESYLSDLQIDNDTYIEGVTSNSLKANLSINSYISYSWPQSMVQTEFRYLFLWMKSQESTTLCFTFKDSNGEQYIKKSITDDGWQPIMIDFVYTPYGILNNLTEIVISIESTNAEVVDTNVGFIATANNVSHIRSDYSYSVTSQMGKYFLDIESYNSCLVVLPENLEIDPNFVVSENMIVYPDGIVWVIDSSSINGSFTMVNSTTDIRSYAKNYISRPVTANLNSPTVESFRFTEPTLISSEVSLWGGTLTKIEFNQTWSWSTVCYSIEPMISGFAYVSILYFGNTFVNDLCFSIFEDLNQARTRNVEPLLEMSIISKSKYRWIHIPILLSNSEGICLRIDNHDALGVVYFAQPRVYSYGGYF